MHRLTMNRFKYSHKSSFLLSSLKVQFNINDVPNYYNLSIFLKTLKLITVYVYKNILVDIHELL